MPPWASPSSYQSNSTSVFREASNTVPATPPQHITYGKDAASDGPVTVIALRAGRTALLAQRYWVEGGKLHSVSDGVEQEIPLEQVDLAETVKLNQERNVDFVLQSKETAEQ